MQAETKRIKKKNPQRNVGHFKCIDICILGISEGEEIKEQEKKVCRNNSNNFSSLLKSNLHIQKDQQPLTKINTEIHKLTHHNKNT